MDPTSAADSQDATQELVAGPASDRCASCQTPLAPDQRYCVNCGERRGKTRFSFASPTAKPAPASAPERPRRRPTISSGLSLILGIATLLLAMGVGVLIGHNNNTKATQAAAAPQVIKIQGGGGNSAATNTTPASTQANSFKATKTPKLTTKVVKKVQAAAAKVLGSQKNLSQNVTQAVGGACKGGSGCQGGKFTGNYFGQ
jgi:hypothetical protein